MMRKCFCNVFLKKFLCFCVDITFDTVYNPKCGKISSGGDRMKFNFDWNYVAAGAPYITISELALGFNAPSISLLGNPEEVIIGFDDQTMTIGVKKYDGNENVKSYKFYSRMKNGWVRIGCKEFIKYLSSLTGLEFSPAIRYIAKYDEQEEILYISVLDALQSPKYEEVDEDK